MGNRMRDLIRLEAMEGMKSFGLDAICWVLRGQDTEPGTSLRLNKGWGRKGQQTQLKVRKEVYPGGRTLVSREQGAQ